MTQHRTSKRISFGLLTLLGVGCLHSTSRAQTDLQAPVPNALLLVDTSGSMEFKADSRDFPTCNPDQPTLTNEKSRWIELIEVLTGTFEEYSCFAQDRKSSAFRTEFALSGNDPYDYGYINPFHRVISDGCVVGPGVLPGSTTPYDFPTKAVNTFTFTAPSSVTRPADLTLHTGCSGFSQLPDGMLDVYRERIRFGLMTFDTHLDAGTGLSAGASDLPDGIEGTWSYYLNGTPKSGKPANCSTNFPQEVGARNAAAPPWEGRMVAFGEDDAPITDTEQRNAWIQKILLSTRPYGATPIAGLLHDAREFLFEDDSSDPLSSDIPPPDFGPYQDKYWTDAKSCRQTVIVLLSDGEPNLDLRPFCEDKDNGGVCPYDKPEDIADDLLNDPPQAGMGVETFVIGFALDEVQPMGEPDPISCADLTDDHCTQNPNDREIQACCTLNKIATNGSKVQSDGTTRKAFFPQTREELRIVFNKIFNNLRTPSTRSSPAFSTAGAGAYAGVRLSASFQPSEGSLWEGEITRERFQCNSDNEPELIPLEEQSGDSFAANVNASGPDARNFISFLSSGDNSNSIRPEAPANDGLGASDGTEVPLALADDFVDDIPAAAMDIAASDCSAATATGCRDMILGWTLGLVNTDAFGRCPAAGADCSLLGGIFNSSPQVVSGPPREFLRDESYQAFAADMATDERPTVLYTSTVDGFLHAFKLAPYSAADTTGQVSTKANNELWNFVPPAVLPVFKAQFPDTPAVLLDGKPVIRDVVGFEDSDGDLILERSVTVAQAGAGDWRTVLVQGFGIGQVEGGYFAVDITKPDPADGGPKFMWQLTRDSSGNPLFGNGGTPLITSVALEDPDEDNQVKEVVVAVLPGGNAGSPTGNPTGGGTALDATSPAYQARSQVQEYDADAAEARSLTIVRLDNGEVIRSFRGTASGATFNSAVVSSITLPSPIVGEPAAFPATPGAVADRIFVGDRDGRLWRVDVSNSDPSNWTMEVFFDTYYDLSTANKHKAQPIQGAPALSVDLEGNITVAVAAGDQRLESVDEDSIGRVVSLTETLNTDNDFETQVNWIETLGCDGACPGGSDREKAERVTGPLALFNSTVYFATAIPETDSSAVCAENSFRIWGIDYLQRNVDSDPTQGGKARLPPASTTGSPRRFLPKAIGTVFGVGIEQQPTCSTPAGTSADDPYLGYGSHTAVQAINPGKFFLLWQVGGATGASSVSTETLELEPPKSSVRIDSWAAVFE